MAVKQAFNGLTTQEWAMNSRSVWGDVSSPRSRNALEHGATFPKKLSDRVVSLYSSVGDLVLDPFLGIGTTALSAVELQRNFVGFELSSDFFSMASSSVEQFLVSIDQANISCKIKHGDCLDLINSIADETLSLTFTSPPYANLIHKIVDDRTNRHRKSAFVLNNNATTRIYSDSQKDFGNMDLAAYEEAVLALMKKIFNKTRNKGYNIWVVKDFRDVKNGVPYVDLHSIIANLGQEAGFKYHDLIVWDQNERRRLVLLGYPSVFYANQNHSFLVVLRKVS
ncbi:methyltransferase (plasmid) [Helicobacter sp. NHP19-003]|uniref:Methyltransferase n=1 Tax=Helicobacter gastrocanis TaxID=2849641 RepID=A0ABM7SFE6_9HELI|nr:site-specific DNA-methyltransferase [Helicobacter sp. NHP19-003]BCZ18347.1 methyltransferase [Helicobacter sp. NHP19-003]